MKGSEIQDHSHPGAVLMQKCLVPFSNCMIDLIMPLYKASVNRNVIVWGYYQDPVAIKRTEGSLV